MTRFRFSVLLTLFLAYLSLSSARAEEEIIVLSGGPSLRYFDEGKEFPHDMYWGNFADGGYNRIIQMNKTLEPGQQITWIMYKPAYITRGKEMNTDLVSRVSAMAAKAKVKLLWIDKIDQFINYVNKAPHRGSTPIVNFEYFGHSNRACFLLDFSNELDGMSTCYLHIEDLRQLDRTAFSPRAKAKSWGCYSGETYSQVWKKKLGFPMIGSIGRTDYVNVDKGQLPFLSSPNGKWVE